MNRLQKTLLFFLDILGVNALFRFLNRNKALILYFHGICNDDFKLLRGYDEERHLPRSLFRDQVKYLKKKGYDFATMSKLVELLEKKQNIRKIVSLTFDDGFRNVVENAYPIMKDLNAKGCFYVVSDLIDAKKLLWTDHVETVLRNSKDGVFEFRFNGKPINYKLDSKASQINAIKDIKTRLRNISEKERKQHLQQFDLKSADDVPKEFIFASWEQIRYLDKAVLEVGSHTRNHPNCANLNSHQEFQEEITDSRAEIGERVGYTVNHFSYPAGSFNDKVIQYLKKDGYDSAVTTEKGFNDSTTDLYQLKRIPTAVNFLLFKAATSGSYYFYRRIKDYLSQLGFHKVSQ